MNNETKPSYDTVAYNDLKKLAAERGLPATGTKEELIASLEAADAGNSTQRPQATAPSVKPETDLDKKYKSKALRTKAALDKQPKVMVFIPFEQGEKPEQAAKIKFVVNINGYQLDIPRGVAVEIPKQVADMVRERLESEGKAQMRAGRIDTDPSKQEALS